MRRKFFIVLSTNMAALSSCVCKPRIFGNWYYITLKFLFILSICLALSSVIYLAISPLFALNHNLFPSKWERNTKPKQPIRIQGLFKVTNQITGKCSVIYSQIALIFAPSHISFCSLDQWWRWGGGGLRGCGVGGGQGCSPYSEMTGE